MNKFWLIVFHTYLKHLKSRSFWVSSIITIIIISLFTNAGNFYSKEKEKEIVYVGILGESKLVNVFTEKVENKTTTIKLKSYETEEQAKKDTKEKKLSAYISLKNDPETFVEGSYRAMEIVNQGLILELETLLNETKKTVAIEQLGLSEEAVSKVNQKITFEKKPLKEAAKNENEINQSLVVVFIGLMLIYATVVFYGNIIATEVASEKSTRIMEVLVSSVSSTTQMFGKVIGLALLNITQYALYFVVVGMSFQKGAIDLQEIPTSTFVYAGVFILLGYFLYAMLLAMLGSVVNRTEDVQQFIAPVNALIIIGFVLSLIGFIDPKTELVTYGSFIPFFAPMLMFLRVSILSVPTWEIVLSISLLLGTIVAFTLIGAKVYKGGVLIYDKTTYKNILKAFKLTKNK